MSDLIRRDGSDDEGLRPQLSVSPLPAPGEGALGGLLDIREHSRTLQRRIWLLVAVGVTVVALFAIQVFTTTKLYRATASVQIEMQTANVLPYEEVASTAGSSPWTRLEDIQTQARKLSSRSLARRVIVLLDLENDETFNAPVRRGFLIDSALGAMSWVRRLLPSAAGSEPASNDGVPDALVERLLARVQITPIRSTRLINVSYVSADPHQAAAVVNALTDEFIEQHLEGKYNATTKATDFLLGELDKLKAKVERSEEELLGYAQRHKIMNLTERDTINRKKLGDLSNSVTESEAELIAVRARYNAVPAAGGEFPEILMNDTLRDLEQKRSDLQQERSVLADRFGPEWPEVRELERKEGTLDRQITDQRTQAISRAREEYLLAKDRYESLADALARQRTVVDRLDENSIQYRILDREVETNKELYEGLLQRTKEAGVAAGLRSSNIQIADAAIVPRTPASPRKVRTMLLAAFLGLMLGVGAVFAAESMDNTVKTTEDVTQLGLPALGFVPTLAASEGQKSKMLLPGGGVKDSERRPLIAYSEARRFQARDWEAYRSIRTSILLSHSDKPPQAILVTSALPAEGKTTTASNIALALAQTGARTVMVDLDLRRPSLGALFGFPSGQGMSTYLSGNADLLPLVRETTFPNLSVVPSGPPAPNPAELVGSERLRAGIEELRKHFDMILVDTPPSLELTDARVVSPHVDGVILVTRSGKTPKEALRRLRERFTSVGATVLGALLNDVDFSSSSYGEYYHRYYGDYYGNQAATESKKKGA